MKKKKILGIVFGVMFCVLIIKVIVPPSLLNYKGLLELFGFKESEQEVVLEERSIELKGVSDPRKILYETDNALIKISYAATDEYFLQEIKYYKNAIREDELLLSGAYKDHPNIIERKKNTEHLLREGEELMNWLKSQGGEKEINISNSPYGNFLKKISVETVISIRSQKGEAEIYDKNNKRNVNFVKLKVIGSGSSFLYRFYLPDGTMFFDL